ncbi:tetratricopeptide repeat protein [Streptomyces sp. NPDC059506]|uniref:tetratricopeptide repeat protein n=1 Tax=unclassified Streptomyces TaxID=2593676 RepID=UPI000CAED8AA|nr:MULTISPECIES: tetratricopeptide repeat protein [unclassified Streptomyces]MCZ2523753.1 tetratricopeptide repeat protein [Streptomyces sp. HB2AG]PLW71691.1 transcriptional regulator [Streptomyces sp. DJ]QMV22381.1 tetratricopeptide repeat protein [Streptomyces sp. SCUT-3]
MGKVAVHGGNDRLASLVEETGWTYAQFARAVNRAGTEAGLALKYDESSVWHWLNGTVPRARVLPVVLEVLSRRLNRPVYPAAAGFRRTPAGSSTAVDTVDGLAELGAADMDPSRRSVLGAAGLYSVALAVPGYPDAAERFDALRRNPRARIGQGEVDTVVAVTERISAIDDMFGGRHARPMAAAFLVNTIAPYLRADASEKVRRAMLSAAADHCYLTGYMAMDERADGLAQQYYLKALELAGGAEDHLAYCTTLRGMSVQAVDLGHGPHALRLADAASAASPEAGPRMRSFLAGQQAHAAAVTGDRSLALAKLAEAERAMEKAEARAKAFGSYDPSSLSYHTAQVRYALGDKKAAIAALEDSDRQRESAYRRGRVRHLGMLAERKLETGLLEEACSDWNRALDDYPHVQSGRCDDRFRAMLAAIRPHLKNRHARALYERARTTAPAQVAK